MKEYSQLTEMGILHPEQIEKFSVNSVSNFDVLRISYHRAKGSLLPLSRKYKYPRVQRTAVVNSEAELTADVMETNPALRSAIAELQDLLETKQRQQNAAESILEELQSLEEDVAMRSKRIKELIGKI